MKYFEVIFKIVPCDEVHQDLLCALLGDAGFETFENTDDGIKAWIQRPMYDMDNVKEVISNDVFAGSAISFDVAEAPDEDWNSTWEQEGFRPIIIEPDICIHDTKHLDVPKCRYDIVINPCQAFGTGSHETTRMILCQLRDMNLNGLEIVDAGTGTGILSIMCSMLGAEKVYAYDIDEWSVNNTQSNLKLNNINNVSVALGDSSVLAGRKADLLIANINRNILLGDLPRFVSVLKIGGRLLLSGFYEEDVSLLEQKAAEYGMARLTEKHSGEWTMLLLGNG